MVYTFIRLVISVFGFLLEAKIYLVEIFQAFVKMLIMAYSLWKFKIQNMNFVKRFNYFGSKCHTLID